MGTVGILGQQEDPAWDRPQSITERNLYLLHENHKSSLAVTPCVVDLMNHETQDDFGEGQTLLQDSSEGRIPIPKDPEREMWGDRHGPDLQTYGSRAHSGLRAPAVLLSIPHHSHPEGPSCRAAPELRLWPAWPLLPLPPTLATG